MRAALLALTLLLSGSALSSPSLLAGPQDASAPRLRPAPTGATLGKGHITPLSPPRTAHQAMVEEGLERFLRTGVKTEAVVALRAPTGSPRDLPRWREAIRGLQQDALACAGLKDAQVLTSFAHLPMLHVLLDWKDLERLRRCPQVEGIGENHISFKSLSESVPLVGGNDLSPELGLDGTGYTVAIVDTGVDYTDPAMGGCIGASCKVIDGGDFADEDSNPTDCDVHYRHGTNVASIAAGLAFESEDPEQVRYRGVAPGANVAALKVFGGVDDCEFTNDVYISQAMDWIVANRDKYNIITANMSLGGAQAMRSTCDNLVYYTAAINTVTRADVLVVAAAGNDAFKDAVSYPACLSNVMAVANIYDQDLPYGLCWGPDGAGGCLCEDEDPREAELVCCSNGGELVDVAAPGALIAAGGVEIGGTSQASPHVAGASLLLKQANPKLDAPSLFAALTVSSYETKDTRTEPPFIYPRLYLPDVVAAIPDVDQDGYLAEEDCAPADPAIHPGATELCNGVDEDCDGIADNGFDQDKDGVTTCKGDCDDQNAAVLPNATDVGDGIDNDCDGYVDENASTPPPPKPTDVQPGACECSTSSTPLPPGAFLTLLAVWLGFRSRSRRCRRS